jgi:HEAT repeat protein
VEAELEQLLGVLQRARQARAEGDDLLTLLWEADLQHVKYFYIDLLAEGVEVPEPGAPATRLELTNLLQSEAPDGRLAPSGSTLTPTPELVSREDFNPTLYALDPREMDYLRTEIVGEMERDVRSAVQDALLDRLEEGQHPERQSEILGIVHTLLPTLLSRGQIRVAATLLEELRSLESRPGVLDDERRSELTALIDTLSGGDVMRELVRALEDGSIAPAPTELGAFLQHLRAGALAPLLRAAELLERSELRPVLLEAVRGIASRHLRALAALLAHEDPLVVAGAARLASRLKVAAITGALGTLFRHEDARVRLASIEAAVELRATTIAGGLELALDDVERDVRIAAARALGALRYRTAARRLKDILQSRELRGADLSERIAFFESYGQVGQEDAVPHLDRLLNGRGFLGRKEPSEIRACAALGLGRAGSPEAVRALEKAVATEDPVVRSAVNRALRGGGE